MSYAELVSNPVRDSPQSPPQNPPAAQVPPPLPEPPFVIRVEHRDVDRRGYFRPQAHVAFAASLRTGGLLSALSPEALRDLLLLLSFVTPNGNCAPALHQVAEAMRISTSKARGRLERLEELRFQGQPLLVHGRSQNGLEFFSPRPWLAPAREDARPDPPHSSSPPIRAASRQDVIEHSRAAYARPRAEVERQIEEAMGYGRDGKRLPRAAAPPVKEAVQEEVLSEEEREARREREEVRQQLLEVGLLPEQAQALLEGHDLLGIRRQLAWLPYRRAKNPAGMLLAAVKDDYEAPQVVRRQQAEPPSEPPPAPEDQVEEQALGEALTEVLEVSLRLPEHAEEGS